MSFFRWRANKIKTFCSSYWVSSNLKFHQMLLSNLIFLIIGNSSEMTAEPCFKLYLYCIIRLSVSTDISIRFLPFLIHLIYCAQSQFIFIIRWLQNVLKYDRFSFCPRVFYGKVFKIAKRKFTLVCMHCLCVYMLN